MSKILFTVALNHDGRRPQFVISTNNLYAVQVSGKDFAHPKIGNANVGGGFKNRFEYAVTGGKGITRLSLWVYLFFFWMLEFSPSWGDVSICHRDIALDGPRVRIWKLELTG